MAKRRRPFRTAFRRFQPFRVEEERLLREHHGNHGDEALVVGVAAQIRVGQAAGDGMLGDVSRIEREGDRLVGFLDAHGLDRSKRRGLGARNAETPVHRFLVPGVERHVGGLVHRQGDRALLVGDAHVLAVGRSLHRVDRGEQILVDLVGLGGGGDREVGENLAGFVTRQILDLFANLGDVGFEHLSTSA